MNSCFPIPKNSCEKEISELGSNQSPKRAPKLYSVLSSWSAPVLTWKILWFLSSQMTQKTASNKNSHKTLAFFLPPKTDMLNLVGLAIIFGIDIVILFFPHNSSCRVDSWNMVFYHLYHLNSPYVIDFFSFFFFLVWFFPFFFVFAIPYLRLGEFTFLHIHGIAVFEEVTKNAVRGLWARQSRLHLVGVHVNVFTGEWTQKLTFLIRWLVENHTTMSLVQIWYQDVNNFCTTYANKNSEQIWEKKPTYDL